MFEKELRRYDLSLKNLQGTEVFAKALAEAGAKTMEDLLALIGYGTVSAKQFLGKLVPAERLREKAPEGVVTAAVGACSAAEKRRSRCGAASTICWSCGRAAAIRSGARRSSATSRAGKGVSVHSATCPNVVNLLYDPERRIDVEWDKGDAVANYTVKLTMEVEDRKGLLAAVSAKIADINTNIKNMDARTGGDDQRARIDVTVEISDLKHLEKVIKSLRSVDGVLDVERAGGRGELRRQEGQEGVAASLALPARTSRSRRSRCARRAAASRPLWSNAPDTAR